MVERSKGCLSFHSVSSLSIQADTILLKLGELGNQFTTYSIKQKATATNPLQIGLSTFAPHEAAMGQHPYDSLSDVVKQRKTRDSKTFLQWGFLEEEWGGEVGAHIFIQSQKPQEGLEVVLLWAEKAKSNPLKEKFHQVRL